MATDVYSVGQVAMGLLGGLALFLFGMSQMTDALKLIAGEGMRNLLARLTTNRVAGAFTGAVVTAIVQSSSVTTVLVVGSVTAGLMTLTQSIGVIMGANIGTTVTAQIIAFRVVDYALALIAVGFTMQFLGRRQNLRQYGLMLLGLGLIFFGMGQMSEAVRPLRDYEPLIELMQQMTSPVLAIVVGALFTAFVQSSSATTGIIIVLAGQGFIPLTAGIGLALGANIGTCVTAMLATLGSPRTAKRAALVHVLFNVAGVVLWVGLIDELAAVVEFLSPTHPELSGLERLAAESPRQIANAHALFNVANAIVLLPFSGLIAWLVTRVVPDRPEPVPHRAQSRFLDEVYLRTPGLAMDRVRLEVSRLGAHVLDLAGKAVRAVREGAAGELDGVTRRHDEAESLYEAIVGYIRRLQETQISEEQSGTGRLNALIAVASDIEHVNEIFATNIVHLARARLRHDHSFESQAAQMTTPLYDVTMTAFADSIRAFKHTDAEMARQIIELKPRVQALARQVEDKLNHWVRPGDSEALAAFRHQTNVVELLLRLYYFAKKIAKEVVNEAEQVRVKEPEETDSGTDMRS